MSFSPEIQKRIDSLPEDVRKLVYSADMDTVLQDIGRKHSLHIDQLEALEAETAALMIGMTDANDFTENLADVLNLDQQKSGAIAKDVDVMLFGKIRESMRKVYEKSKSEPVVTSVVPAAVQTPSTITKSVVMPSSVAASPKPVAAMPPTPQISTPAPSTPMAPKPILPRKPAEMHPTDLMMTEKTVQVAPSASVSPTQAPKQESSKPVAYKADPYREPPE